MTIRHLRIFLTVVECGAMRRAAEKLYISQPSVSQSIQELEKHYNTKLFDRLSQKLYLTESGERLLTYARQIIDLIDNVELIMRNLEASPRIRIGASVSVGTHLINNVLDVFEAKLKDTDINVKINNTATIEKDLIENKLDIAIVEGFVTEDSLIKVPLWEDELVMIVGKGHPLFKEDTIELSMLRNENLITREEGSTERNQYDQLLRDSNINMKRKWSSSNTEAIKNAVIHGKGLGIISKLFIEKELSEGVLKILYIKGIKVTRDLQLIYHKDKYISPVLQGFIDVCRDMAHKD